MSVWLVLTLQQRVELAFLVERVKVVATADMLAVNENLRNGAFAA